MTSCFPEPVSQATDEPSFLVAHVNIDLNYVMIMPQFRPDGIFEYDRLTMIRRRLFILRAKPFKPSRKKFRQRYDDLEAQRADLVARLRRLSEASKQHPGYKHALKLLNGIYRREKLAQRLEVLHSASWLISLLERSHNFQ